MKKLTDSQKKLIEIRQRAAIKAKEPGGSSRWARRGSVLAFLLSISKPKLPKLYGEGNRLTLNVPRRFSLIDNPEETLFFIANVAFVSKLISGKKLKGVEFNHTDVGVHDLGAEILLGVAALELQTIAELRRVNLTLSGKYPAHTRKARLIRKMGVVKKLRIASAIDTSELKDIKIFDEKGSKELHVEPGAKDAKNRIVTKFVDHINDCLLATERVLTESAKGDLVNFLGEIVGNAEDHSGAKSWHICGYLDDCDELQPDEIRFCEIVIYNFGKSFADTFVELPADSYAVSLVKPYLDHHSARRLFSKQWAKTDLLTLAALQSNISCKNIDENSDRGQGTVDLIEFFQKVARECVTERSKEAKMVLITGSTHITFDEKYQIQKDEFGREIIAFNESNDLNEVPDRNYVSHLSQVRFPGALIAIRFPLKYKDTEKVKTESEVPNE